MSKFDVSSFSVTGDIYIHFQTSHFEDFEQLKVDIYFDDFRQVKIAPMWFLLLALGRTQLFY